MWRNELLGKGPCSPSAFLASSFAIIFSRRNNKMTRENVSTCSLATHKNTAFRITANNSFSVSVDKNDTKKLPLFVGRKEVEEMTQAGIHILHCLVLSFNRVGTPSKT